jgi:XRE family aerobic/anaerobic benzoate catabolism transcriptional regulator
MAVERNIAQKRRPIEGTPGSPGEAQFLAGLGARVRDLRAQRGMTRKLLAGDSGVSERFLASLEAGVGNPSLLTLRRVARGLNVEAQWLMQERDTGETLAAIVELLQAQPAASLDQVHHNLRRQLGATASARRRRIALLGLRGAGKSTLGVRLARKLRVPFIELDREIEAMAGTSLNEIFLLYGQAGFRRYERAALERVLREHRDAVIATGGSLVSEPGTFDLLLANATTIWLKAPPAEHMTRVVAQGDMRPMSGNREAMADLKRILASRERLYARADAQVDTGEHDVDASLDALLATVRNLRERTT